MSLPGSVINGKAILPSSVGITEDYSGLQMGPMYTVDGISDTVAHIIIPSDATQQKRNFTKMIQIVQQATTASKFTILDGATVIYTGYIGAVIGTVVNTTPILSSVGNAISIKFATGGNFSVNCQGLTA